MNKKEIRFVAGFVAAWLLFVIVLTGGSEKVCAEIEIAGKQLRSKILKTTAAELGIKPTQKFPDVYAVLMDMPVANSNVATIFASCLGDASLYTTSLYGIIGGIDYPHVRQAAVKLVKMGNEYAAEARSDEQHAYPGPDMVYFYLLTFDGVKKIEVSLRDVQNPQNKYYAFGMQAQEVLSCLRQTVPVSGKTSK